MLSLYILETAGGMESSTRLLVGVVQAMIAAAIYSILAYGKRQRVGEPFVVEKFCATIIVGAMVGALVFLTPGVPISPDEVAARLAAYAGLVAIVENLMKIALADVSPAPEVLKPRRNP